MERFFTLENLNTFYDLGFIVTAKDITPPEPKTNYVDLDGRNGSLDLSEALTGEITYEDRTITASFWTDNGTYKERESLLNKIVALFHGKKIKIIEPDDPDHYYIGRVKISGRNNILPYAEFSLEAVCEPWRYGVEPIVRRVDLRNSYADVVINNEGVKTIIPTLTVTGDSRMMIGNEYIKLNSGTYKILDVKLKQGVNVIKLKGNGSVTFTYEEATL